MHILGIDLSLTSPSLCFHKIGEPVSFDTCDVHYLTDVKKSLIQHERLHGTQWPVYGSDEERYDKISNWVIDSLSNYNVQRVYIEGYAFNAVGRVFQIAENTGILKYKFWQRNIKCITVPPTVIKKFATGKGNANKEILQNSFLEETGVNLKELLKLTDKQWNPSSDIIDSYYVCKYGALDYGKKE